MMGRRLQSTDSLSRGIEEAIIFDLICWWQEAHPGASLYEMADWWDSNRSLRTPEEFSRLLGQIVSMQCGHANNDSNDSPPMDISGEMQQRIEQGVLRCIAYL